jgi:hypothetical protein
VHRPPSTTGMRYTNPQISASRRGGRTHSVAQRGKRRPHSPAQTASHAPQLPLDNHYGGESGDCSCVQSEIEFTVPEENRKRTRCVVRDRTTAGMSRLVTIEPVPTSYVTMAFLFHSTLRNRPLFDPVEFMPYERFRTRQQPRACSRATPRHITRSAHGASDEAGDR